VNQTHPRLDGAQLSRLFGELRREIQTAQADPQNRSQSDQRMCALLLGGAVLLESALLDLKRVADALETLASNSERTP
jgi:hypothetical protein